MLWLWLDRYEREQMMVCALLSAEVLPVSLWFQAKLSEHGLVGIKDLLGSRSLP